MLKCIVSMGLLATILVASADARGYGRHGGRGQFGRSGGYGYNTQTRFNSWGNRCCCRPIAIVTRCCGVSDEATDSDSVPLAPDATLGDNSYDSEPNQVTRETTPRQVIQGQPKATQQEWTAAERAAQEESRLEYKLDRTNKPMPAPSAQPSKPVASEPQAKSAEPQPQEKPVASEPQAKSLIVD